MQNIDRKPIRWAIAVGTALSVGMTGYTQDSDDEEEIFELSPFEVTGNDDNGYRATSTLAGTRIRTDLKDVGSAISVYTDAFLDDVGATDNGTLLQYTTNAEVGGTQGTYSGLGNGASLDESSSLRAPTSNNRIRGLSSAENTRDFFVSDIPWDSYNVDRVDIQRGANSILFGLGKPAGIINATLTGASFADEGEASFRFGSYGSLRASVSLNRVLVEDVLAIRIAGLWDHEEFSQNPAFEDDERVYVALRYDPDLFENEAMKTSFKFKFENGAVDANRPRTITPNDSISPWFRSSTVSASNPFGGAGKAVVGNPYDSRATLEASGDELYSAYIGTIVNDQQPYWMIDGATGETFGINSGWIGGGLNADGSVRTKSNSLVGKRYGQQFFRIGNLPGAAGNLDLPLAEFGQYRNMSMTDDSIFNYNDILIDGNTKSEFEDWEAINLDFSQTAFNDRLGVQLSYDKQDYMRGGEALLGGSPTITIDITENFLDLSSNPNFGRPFVTSGNGGSGNSYESSREYVRASVFGELRAEDFFDQDSLMTKLLGKHRINGVYSTENYKTENRNWQRKANHQEWAGYWNGNSGSTSAINDRGPTGVIYLGPSVNGLSSSAGANIPGITGDVDMNSGAVYLFDPTWTAGSSVNPSDPWNPPANLQTIFPIGDDAPDGGYMQNSNPANYVGWNSNRALDLLSYDGGANTDLLRGASLTQRETSSIAVSWQAFLWDGAIVPTFGWREDEVKGRGTSALAQAGNRNIRDLSSSYALPSTYPTNQVFKDQSRSHGIVVHLNELFEDKLPLNVSLSYNKSSNFEVSDTRRDLYGTPIANPSGETKDVGISLATKDGKFSFRAIKYESKVSLSNSSLDVGGLGATIREGLKWRNVFLYDLSVYDWGTRDSDAGRHAASSAYPIDGSRGNQPYAVEEGSPEERALEDSIISEWNSIQAWLTAVPTEDGPKNFFDAWGFTPVPLNELPANKSEYAANPGAWVPSDTTTVTGYSETRPQGFTVTADTLSKGYEYEFTANPTDNWRIAFNASKTEAFRTNVGGPLIDQLVNFLDERLLGTVAGNTPRWGNPGGNINPSSYSPWRANYVRMKLQEDTAAPELRKWRFNVITNYTFTDGKFKDFSVGGSYRWQDKVAIGYPLVPLGASYTFDIDNPIYGPSEDAIDLWASYGRPINDKIDWKVRLNVRNAFAGDELIPISIQPDNNTWASARIAPKQEWFITNTFSF